MGHQPTTRHCESAFGRMKQSLRITDRHAALAMTVRMIEASLRVACPDVYREPEGTWQSVRIAEY
jgi:hypothetical protein